MGTLKSLDDVIAATHREPESRLKVDKILDDLADHPDAERLREMLEDADAWTSIRMAAILAKLTGAVVSYRAVDNWRSRQAA